MSDHRTRTANESPEGDDHATWAALAAVEGRGTLEPEALASLDDELVEEFEHAAGLVFRVFHDGLPKVAPPVDLEKRLEVVTTGHLESLRPQVRSSQPRTSNSAPSKAPAVSRSPRRGPSIIAWSGWAVAAGALAFGLSRGQVTATPDRPAITVADRLAQLLETPGTSISPWAVGDVTGDVIWNDERNDGFMRLAGLPVNDPANSQYQLWIFRGDDPAAEEHPVDGGVFDVRSAKGSVTVPIDAKLSVGGAGFFAVTVEQPGGVVVSKREAIVAAAPRV